jgi:hypothetical protein
MRCRALLPLLLTALVLATLPGCEDEQLLEPDEAGEGALFNNYVAIGNSITAGFQSGGINASTQEESYAVDLAAKMDTDFTIPRLSVPGCPPPLVQIFPTTERLGGPNAPECALRDPDVPRVVNNVAVPGAEVIDATSNLDPTSNSNPLTTFILGGRTQLEAALDADPTFASVWIGNNDVLGAALAGEAGLITDVAAFEERYSNLLDGLGDAENLQGGLLISVADVTTTPALSAGAAYFAAIPQAQAAGLAPPNFQIADSCVPVANGGVGDQTLVPFQHGATLLQVATALAEQLGPNAPTITLDCAQDRTVRETVGAAFGGVGNIPPAISGAIAGTSNISILTGAEIAQLKIAVQRYNAFIQQQAEAEGYAYLDVNPLFTALKAGGQIPLFPALTSDQPFGPLFSLDGVHPSGAAHDILAEATAAAINDEYGTNLPVDAGALPSGQ